MKKISISTLPSPSSNFLQHSISHHSPPSIFNFNSKLTWLALAKLSMIDPQNLGASSPMSRFFLLRLILLSFGVESLDFLSSSLENGDSARVGVPVDARTTTSLETCHEAFAVHRTTLDHRPDAGWRTFYWWTKSRWRGICRHFHSFFIWTKTL